MSPSNDKSVRMEYLAKLILIVVFLGGFALFTGWMMIYGPGLEVFSLSWMDLVLLAFATYRLGHLIAYDRVTEPLRSFFTKTVPDPTGAGDTVEPKGKGFQQAFGQLLSCPICSGTWVAALLVYALYLFPGPTRVFLVMTAAIGAAELINAASEMFCWTGQYMRTMSGAQMLNRQKSNQQGAIPANVNPLRDGKLPVIQPPVECLDPDKEPEALERRRQAGG
ncbi:MAG: DUF1360 domain-containing protein [Chloroflexi bacterium]|nr:DUF1360 domain-containing protein [Chloroflexota bacterium]